MGHTIASIIAIVCCLILVTSGSRFRSIGLSKGLRYAVIWAAIIVGLVLAIQLSGVRIQ